MKTHNINLAAALISLGAGIQSIDRTNPRKMEFVLCNASPTINDEEAWFHNKKDLWDKRELLVNGQDFVDARSLLQEEVHK